MADIVQLKDVDGRIHHSARESKFAVDGLADGSLTEVDENGNPVATEEVDNDATESAATGDDPDAGKRGRKGSGDRQRTTSATDDSAQRAGEAESGSGS